MNPKNILSCTKKLYSLLLIEVKPEEDTSDRSLTSLRIAFYAPQRWGWARISAMSVC